ncbi:MAG: dCTP deaminase [Cytophagales bacterium]|nr:dCTP deaminase [Cytophagales bacterium]
MILTGSEISANVEQGRINISPFRSEQLNPNSYDLRLGKTLLVYTGEHLDSLQPNPYELVPIPEEGTVLQKGAFYLGASEEIVGSDYFVPMLHCKSGIARLGLFIHITSDLIDIGSHGNLTFQLHPTLNIRVYPGMRLGQVSFWKPLGDITLYEGKYQNSKGPIASKNYFS